MKNCKGCACNDTTSQTKTGYVCMVGGDQEKSQECELFLPKKLKRRTGDLLDEHPISDCGLLRGSLDYTQRRSGRTPVRYDTWLSQGVQDNDPTDFFIAEEDIQPLINFLEACKIKIDNNKQDAKAEGHKVRESDWELKCQFK